MSLINICGLQKSYNHSIVNKVAGDREYPVLRGIDFNVEKGDFISIMGHSGCGKTTLLKIMGTIDKPTKGKVFYEDVDVRRLGTDQLAELRKNRIGFVFQDFNLLDSLSLRDNIFLPLVLAGTGYGEMERRLEPLAAKLGIADLLNKYPYEVSGGQKQRAAVCRALITKPDIILADEPTGALDSKASNCLLNLFADINREGQTILMVTHSIQAASHAGRVLFIKDGSVFHQIYRGKQPDEEMYKMISDSLTVLTASRD